MRKNELVHPTVEKRRTQISILKNQVLELGRSETLVDAGKALLTLQNLLLTTSDIYGIKLYHPTLQNADPNSDKEVKDALLEQAGGNKKIVASPMPGRSRYNSIKEAILTYATDHEEFTVDDLIENIPALKNKSRNGLVANLLSLSTRGSQPIRQTGPGTMGPKGKPATYTLR